MAWQRRNGRLIRGNDSALVTLPQRTRRRRAKPKPQQQNRLKALPVDVAPKIFAFLAPGEAIRVAIRVEATDKTARSFTRYCFRELNTSAVDVKHGLSLMQAYARRRAPLVSLTVHLGAAELPMLRWLLETCDTTNLSRVRVVISRPVPKMLLLAHASRESGYVITDADAFEVPTMDDFRRIVAWTPDPTLRPAVSALRSLTLVSCADDVLRLFGASDGSCELPNVRTLRMTLPQRASRFRWDAATGLSVELPSVVNDFALLRWLPRLHTFHLNGCADTRISIASPTLRVLDLARAGKHCFIHSVSCPMLTHLHVGDSSYGSGIRRVVPLTAEMAEDWNHDDVGQPVIKWGEKPREYRWSAIGEGAVSVPAAGSTWVAPHHEDRESGSFRVIALPAACTVHFE
jgi:hypothetical protein